jgi:hypothetical protein
MSKKPAGNECAELELNESTMNSSDCETQVESFLSANHGQIGRLQYSTFVLESYSVMYLDTPKAGCTSIKTALCRLLDDFKFPQESDSRETARDMFVHDRSRIPLKSLLDLNRADQFRVLFSNLWKRFCVVRNPFDRVFSAWYSKVLLREPGVYDKIPALGFPPKLSSIGEIYSLFEEFIEYLLANGTESDAHWDTQHDLLFIGQIQWDVIEKYERLVSKTRHSYPKLNGLQLSLPVVNKSGFRPDWTRVSTRTRDAIAELYADDFEIFGYEKWPHRSSDCNSEIDAVSLINTIVSRNLRLEQLFAQRDALKRELAKYLQ